MDDYAPRSPDLSALGSVKSYGTSRRDLRSTPNQYGDIKKTDYLPTKQVSFTTLPQSSQYRPPVFVPQQTSSPAHMQTSHQDFHSQSYIAHFYPQPAQLPYHRFDIQIDDPLQPQHSYSEPYAELPATDALGKRMSGKIQQHADPEPRPAAPGDAEGIIVKTKFPVARIKRIVQADEEVGKVAQATPVAVGKALELFMIQMTLSATTEANARGSKRLAAPHIKAAINRDDKFDFLKDIGDKIPDDPSTGRRRAGADTKPKVENNSEEDIDMDSEEKGRKKLRAGKRRKDINDG